MKPASVESYIHTAMYVTQKGRVIYRKTFRWFPPSLVPALEVLVDPGKERF